MSVLETFISPLRGSFPHHHPKSVGLIFRIWIQRKKMPLKDVIKDQLQILCKVNAKFCRKRNNEKCMTSVKLWYYNMLLWEEKERESQLKCKIERNEVLHLHGVLQGVVHVYEHQWTAW